MFLLQKKHSTLYTPSICYMQPGTLQPFLNPLDLSHLVKSLYEALERGEKTCSFF